MKDILERMRSSVDKGIRTVSSKGKELLETTRIKNEIKNTENAIVLLFQSMGKKTFEMLNKGSIEAEKLESIHSEIQGLYRKMNELEEELRKVELQTASEIRGTEVKKCSACGAMTNAPDRFCSECGAKMNTVAEGPICPECGTPLKEGANFCIKCGNKFGELKKEPQNDM